VVRLRDHRKPAVGQALDEVELPQRSGPVQPAAEQPPDQRPQLFVTAGAGQGGPTDVVVELEVRVVHPHRQAHVPGHLAHLLPVTRDQAEPAADQLDERLVVEGTRRGGCERHDPADVHRRGPVFGEQE
jgi:hypothetical protein